MDKHLTRITSAVVLFCLLGGLQGCGGGGGGGGSDSLRPTVTLTAITPTVEYGRGAQLRMQWTNVTSCTGSGGWAIKWRGNAPTDDTGGTDALTATTTFIVTCTGPYGSASASATVGVLPSVTLSSSPQTIYPAEPVTVTWSSFNATSCVRSGHWTGPSTLSGSETFTTFHRPGGVLTLTCSNAAGSRSAAIPIDVLLPVPRVVLVAAPTSGAAGRMGTINWYVENAEACTASGAWSGPRSATSGFEDIGPINQNSTFTLTCTGPGGSTTEAVTFTVVSTTLSLSGSIQLSAAMQTDSDTNDPALPAVRNNTIDVAQSLPNPVTVGGYAAQPMTGPIGQLFNEGDVDDLFIADLQAGQIIELVLGTETVAFDDLDLGLYSTSGVLIDTSVGVERIERLVVPASGTYIIRVEAFSGESNYTLSVGQPASFSSVNAASLRDAFVPGQAIVRMKKDLAPSSQMKAQADSLASTAGMAKVAGEPDRDMLLGLIKDGLSLSATRAKQTESTLPDGLRFADSTQRAKYDTLVALKLLRRDKRVEYAEPNRILRVAATPNDPLYARQQWHYAQMNLPAAWDLTTGSASVVVAVVDTGVRPHPDLAAQLVAGFDFVDVANSSGDGDGLDADAADPGVAAGPGEYSFHGTHVAGTIGAIGNNGRGVTGVAWQTSLMPVRVFGVNGSGTQYAIQQGIRFASRLPNDSGTLPAKQADIINLSLGGAGSCPFSMQQTLNDATAAGVIVVAAAGNDNTSAATWPAGCSNVVSVAAVDAQRTKAPYSNFGDGPSVDVAAPGGDESADRNGDGYPDGIFSTYSQRVGSTFYEDYSSLEGTSMAAPHVAGAVALMKAVAPSLTAAQFNSLLASGVLTDDIGPSGPDSLGVGLINAAKAVRAVASGLPTLPGQLTANPNALNFGTTLTSSDIVVQNSGDAAVAVSDIQSSEPWLSISPLQVDGNGLGTYRITVNRSGLPSGTYGGTVQIAGSTGTPALVNVLAQVSGTEVIADGGMHYMLLIDAVTDTVVSRVNVRARGSSVPFEFSGVATGSYLLVGGTDLNNDSFICDGGEACAAFPNLGRPEVIELTSSKSGIVLTTAYRGDVTAQSATTGKAVAPSQPGYRRRTP